MRRRLILPVAIGLGMTVGLLPLAGAYYLSRERAVAAERLHLRDYAGWTLQRADLAITRAKNSLRRLVMENHELCSPHHLQRLRQLTMDALTVENIDTFKDGKLLCDTWGLSGSSEPMRKPDILLSEDFGLVIGSEPTTHHPHGDLLAVAFGPYHALIRKQSLVDVLRDTPMVLGIATRDGKLLALSGQADPNLVRQLSREEVSGATDQKVFSSSRGPDFIAFAISDRSVVDGRADDELWKLIPIGMVISAIVIGLIVWASRRRMSLAGELRTGIAYREFIAHYQPIIELSTGKCVGAEALIRWRKPDGSWVRPDLFIPYAEDHQLIGPVTDIMIERVLEDMKAALRADPSLHIAINISAEDIQSGRFLDVLSAAIEKAQVNPAQIWLEATERGFMEADAARATLERARELGHAVAIDDFGTGYSSLSLLESLPLNVLKIDKSFIDAIGHEAATSIVTPSIIEMAHTLKFAVVAEGVEKAEQAAYLKAAGVEFAQGWLYSKALPPREFLQYYSQRNAGAPVPEAA
jgi:sensor c-di-GMP phosphodiesterase-like protein